MDISKLYEQLKSVLRANAGAEIAFGKASRIGDAHIVPVARVSFGFGMGGGGGQKSRKKKAVATPESPAEKEDSPEAAEPKSEYGGGGGGSLKTDPIGLYLISGEKMRYLPVISFSQIFSALAFFCLLLYRIQRLKRKK